VQRMQFERNEVIEKIEDFAMPIRIGVLVTW